MEKSEVIKNLPLDYSQDAILFKDLIESLPSPVIIFDSDLRFIVASDRFFDESSLNKEDVKHNDYWYDLVPDMPQSWKAIHQRCLRGEKLKQDEDAFHRADGTIEWWQWEVLPWFKRNSIGGLILWVKNITPQKEAEYHLKKKLKSLSQSNHELLKFAECCAHDLNAPLRTISNYIQILINEIPPEHYQGVRHYADNISQTVQYMSKLIDNILVDSSFDKDSAYDYISLGDVISVAISNLKEMIDSNNVIINQAKMPDIYGNQISLVQVFQNLISNAIKYAKNTPIRIDIQAVECKSHWKILVKDNGVGIAPEDIKRIFKKKIRLSNADIEGFGIGLSQCREIIKKNKGKIWGESYPQEGSTFFFTLPKR